MTEEIIEPEAIELDATGLYCPEPVMLLHNKIKDISAGALLRLIATDASTVRDVPKFCLEESLATLGQAVGLLVF